MTLTVGCSREESLQAAYPRPSAAQITPDPEGHEDRGGRSGTRDKLEGEEAMRQPGLPAARLALVGVFIFGMLLSACGGSGAKSDLTGAKKYLTEKTKALKDASA